MQTDSMSSCMLLRIGCGLWPSLLYAYARVCVVLPVCVAVRRSLCARVAATVNVLALTMCCVHCIADMSSLAGYFTNACK